MLERVYYSESTSGVLHKKIVKVLLVKLTIERLELVPLDHFDVLYAVFGQSGSVGDRVERELDLRGNKIVSLP